MNHTVWSLRIFQRRRFAREIFIISNPRFSKQIENTDPRSEIFRIYPEFQILQRNIQSKSQVPYLSNKSVYFGNRVFTSRISLKMPQLFKKSPHVKKTVRPEINHSNRILFKPRPCEQWWKRPQLIGRRLWCVLGRLRNCEYFLSPIE